MSEWKKLSVDDKPYRKFEKQTSFSNLFLALRAHTVLELVAKTFYGDHVHIKKGRLVNDKLLRQFEKKKSIHGIYFSNFVLSLRAHTFLKISLYDFYWDFVEKIYVCW